MVYKVFLDTNVLVDFFVQSRENHNLAKKLFSLLESKQISGYISESVLNTTAYLLQKDYPANKLKEILLEMLDLITILSSNNKIFKDAYNNNISDLEDAVLYQVAVNNKMDYFISNDKSHFKRVDKNILPAITLEKLMTFLAK